MIQITTQDAFNDFKKFLDDPAVKILSQQETNNGILYKFNTDETIFVAKKLTQKYNPLVFGKNNEENIVNITIEDGVAILYKEINGTIHTEKRAYNNWFLSANRLPHSQKLKGDQYYRYLNEVDSETLREYRQYKNPQYWFPRSDAEGFMLLNGYTYFKNLKIDEVSVLSFDIEATTLDPTKPDAQVVLIANTVQKRGQIHRKLFDVTEYPSEHEMIEKWCKWVNEVDPSIMCGHNIFSYDLPYLNARFGQDLLLGRQNKSIRINSFPSKFRKDGSQQYDYYNVVIPGREIIDTFFLAMKYDIGRNFPSYGLKPIIEHLGLEKENRVKWDFSQYPVKTTLKNPQLWSKFKEYCMDDGDDALNLYKLMIPSFFYLTQSIPKTFQQINNEASGGQLDSLMIRSYLQDGYSQPKTTDTIPFEGAISMGIPGIYQNVRKVDVASLYPSIMLDSVIFNSNKDPKNHMLQILKFFRNERLMNKKLAKDTSDTYYTDLEQSQKIIINSMYGFMGASRLLYNYPRGAEMVTKCGREILLKGVAWATGHTLIKTIKNITNQGKENEETHYEWVLGEKVAEGRGYTLVNVDTDSFSYTNNIRPSKDEFKVEVGELNKLYPSLIQWEDDGVFEKVIIVAAKNYILQKAPEWCKASDYDSEGKIKIKYKGSSITDQKKEGALREFLSKSFDVILQSPQDAQKKLVDLYHQYIKEAINIQDINRWTVKRTITKAVLENDRTNEVKIREALKGQNVQEGDKVWLYTADGGLKQKVAKGELVFLKNGTPKMEKANILKLPQNWTRDEDKEHYIGRVFDTIQILKNIIDIHDFINYNLKKNRLLLDQLG